MAAEEREKAVKKKLQGFLNEMLAVGCVKGFKYFSTYLRGKEEMVCTVLNEPVTPRSTTPTESTPQIFFSGSQPELPVDQKDLMLSQGTQKRLSGYGYMDIGLPPASPSEREITPVKEDSTLFLVAGYGKYSCPYVWVRSNHDRLVKLSEDSKCNKDSPLRLKTTSSWSEKADIHVWEILAELVKLNTRPSPSNPFSVDLEYFDSLDLGERVIALGAMSHLLQQIFSHAPDKAYAGLVADDLKEVTKRHFKDLRLLLKQQPQLSSAAGQGSRMQGMQQSSKYSQFAHSRQGQRSYAQ